MKSSGLLLCNANQRPFGSKKHKLSYIGSYEPFSVSGRCCGIGAGPKPCRPVTVGLITPDQARWSYRGDSSGVRGISWEPVSPPLASVWSMDSAGKGQECVQVGPTGGSRAHSSTFSPHAKIFWPGGYGC